MVQNRLKEIRMKEYMMNQTKFASLLEIDFRQYSRYEKGVIPTLETALKISSVLKKSVNEIFFFD